MANYNDLKTAIQQVIRTNGNEEITGALLQQSLLSMIDSLGAGYQFMGIATPETNPGTPDQKVYYLASKAGTYINFDGIEILNGEAAILSKGTGDWTKTISGFATQQQFSGLELEIYGLEETIQGATTVNSRIVLMLGESYDVVNNADSQVRVQTLNENQQVIETLGYIPENTTRSIRPTLQYDVIEFYCSSGVDVVIRSQKKGIVEKVDAHDSLISTNTQNIKNINLELKGVDINIVGPSSMSRQMDLLLNAYYDVTNNKNSQIRIRTINQNGEVIETLGYIPENTTRSIRPTQEFWGLDFYCSEGVDINIKSVTSIQESLSDNERNVNTLRQELTGNRVSYVSESTSYRLAYQMYKGLSYVIRNNGNASMSAYSINEGGQQTDVFSVSMGSDGERIVTPTEDVYGIGGYCSTGVNLTIKLLNSYDERLENVESLIDGLPSNDILTVNPKSEYDNLLYNAVRGAFGANENLMLLFFSDLHGRVVNLERLARFAERYKLITANVIGGGDFVYNLYSDDFSWWISAFLVTIGNHDVWTTDTSDPSILDYQEGGFYVVKQKPIYDKFIAPFVENWNVIQPANAATIGACYYYKDYGNIRMIVLDSMHFGKGEDISGGQSAQNTWLKNVLLDANTQHKSVIVVSHYWGGAINQIDCSYNDMDATSTDFISALAPASIQEFMDAGGQFICWMCGHSHFDAIGTLTAYPEQFQIVVTNANNVNAEHAQARNEGTKGQDAFNYIAFDDNEKLIKVVRVGADCNRLLQMKRRLVYKYAGENKGLIICE